MAKKKYDNYIFEYDPKMFPKERRPVMAYMDNNLAKGSNFYLIHWILPGFGMQPEWDFPYAGHPPHIHKDAELLFHIGTDPNNPMDLGAEVIMYLGPELEEHRITRTCCIWIPPNFIHSPWKPVRCDRPWIFMEFNQGPVHTEKSYRQILPKEARARMNWAMWPDDKYPEIVENKKRSNIKRPAEDKVVYKINTKKCLKCGLCVTQCPQKAIEVIDKVKEDDGLILYTTWINPKKCTECDECFSFEWWCPAKAIVKSKK